MFDAYGNLGQEAYLMAQEAKKHAKYNPMRDEDEIVRLIGTIHHYLEKYQELTKREKDFEFEHNRFMVAVEIMKKYGVDREFQERCEELNI